MSLEIWKFVQPKLLKLIPVKANYRALTADHECSIQFKKNNLGLNTSCDIGGQHGQSHDAAFELLRIRSYTDMEVTVKTKIAIGTPEDNVREHLRILAKYFNDDTVNMVEERAYLCLLSMAKEAKVDTLLQLEKLNKNLGIAHAL